MKPLRCFTNNIYLHYTILVALVISFNILISFRYFSDEMPTIGDQALYYKIATKIIADRNISSQYVNDIGAVIAPGYSFLLAGLFIFLGNNITYVYFLNILLHVLIALFLFSLMDRISNKLFAWGFSIWLLLYYPIWRMNFQIMMEISSIFFMKI